MLRQSHGPRFKGKVQVNSYGAMKAACDSRRGQHKVILELVGETYEWHNQSQNGIGQLSLYRPAVRSAILNEGTMTP